MVVVAQWYTTLSPSYLLQCQTRATTWLQISALHRAPGHVPLLHPTPGIYVCILYMYISTSVALPAGYTSLVCLCSWQLRRRTLPILVLNLTITRSCPPFPPLSIPGPVKSPAFQIATTFHPPQSPRSPGTLRAIFHHFLSPIISNRIYYRSQCVYISVSTIGKRVLDKYSRIRSVWPYFLHLPEIKCYTPRIISRFLPAINCRYTESVGKERENLFNSR